MIKRVFVEEEVKTYHTPFSIEDIQSATEEGRRAERERVISLLSDDAEIWHSESFQEDLIALIRGEINGQ